MSYKSSDGRETGKLLQVFQSDRTALGQGVGGGGGSAVAPEFAVISASGGTESNVTVGSQTYKTHVYSSPGPSTFTVSSADPGAYVDIELIGGGGGGGAGSFGNGGAGGGSGAFVVVQRFPVKNSPGTYTVTVASGGGSSSFSGASGEPTGETITVTAGAGSPGGTNSGPGGGSGTSSRTDPNNRIRLGTSSGGRGVDARPGLGGRPGGPAFAGYSPDVFLYPTPLEPLSKGLGGSGNPSPEEGGGPPGGPGNPGGIRIYYRTA